MCGIWAYIELIKNKINHQELFNNFMNLKHRGPDVSNYQIIQ
jgi:asparagine synthetase B (glutamine-hydrolysing)